MENKLNIDLELVDKVREFLMQRWLVNFSKNGGTAVPYDQWDDNLLHGQSNIKDVIEGIRDNALSFVTPRLDEFGDGKEYVIDLLNNEDAGPDEVGDFLRKFKPKSATTD